MFSFPPYFLYFQTREVNCRAFFIEASSEICKASKERVRKCKDYIIGREIATLLKIAVDNVHVILGLCDSL